MAKINYIKYDNKRVLIKDSKDSFWDELKIEEPLKIGMGEICLKKNKTGLEIVRFSRSGNINFKRKIFPGWTVLTPGGAYSPLPSSKENDPVKKILRKTGHSLSKLEIVPAGEQVICSGPNDAMNSASNASTTWYEHNGEREYVGECAHFGYCVKTHYQYKFSNCTYVVKCLLIINSFGNMYEKADKIYVWENATQADLKELEEILSPMGKMPPWESGEIIETHQEYKLRCLESGIKKIIFNNFSSKPCYDIYYKNGGHNFNVSKEMLDEIALTQKNMPKIITEEEEREKEARQKEEEKKKKEIMAEAIKKDKERKEKCYFMGIPDNGKLPEDLVNAINGIRLYLQKRKVGFGEMWCIVTPSTEEDLKHWYKENIMQSVHSGKIILFTKFENKNLREFFETLKRYKIIYSEKVPWFRSANENSNTTCVANDVLDFCLSICDASKRSL